MCISMLFRWVRPMTLAQATYTTLTKPFSLNNAYANGNKGRFPTKKYKAWKIAVGWEFKSQLKAKVIGRYKLIIRVNEHVTKADIDNLIKGFADVLVTIGATEDDSIMRGVDIEYEDRENTIIWIESRT